MSCPLKLTELLRLWDGLLLSIDFFICIFTCLFLCFFVSEVTRKRLDRFARNFQGRRGLTMGRPDSILGQFRETARCATRGRGLLCFLTTACFNVRPKTDKYGQLNVAFGSSRNYRKMRVSSSSGWRTATWAAVLTTCCQKTSLWLVNKYRSVNLPTGN